MPLPMINDLAKRGKKSPNEVEKMWQDTEKSVRQSGSSLPDEEVYKRVVGGIKSSLGIEEEVDSEDEICWNCNGEGVDEGGEICPECDGGGYRQGSGPVEEAKLIKPKSTKGEYYVDKDENGLYGVFHTESDKEFASYADRGEAEEEARKLNKVKKEEATCSSDIAVNPERLGGVKKRIMPEEFRNGLPVFEVEEMDFLGATKIRRDGTRYKLKNEKVKQFLSENGYRATVVIKNKDRYFILK